MRPYKRCFAFHADRALNYALLHWPEHCNVKKLSRQLSDGYMDTKSFFDNNRDAFWLKTMQPLQKC